MNLKYNNQLLQSFIRAYPTLIPDKDIRLCEIVARQLHEDHWYYRTLALNSNFKVKFDPTHFSLELFVRLHKFGLERYADLFFSYSQHIFMGQLRSGADIMAWNESMDVALTAIHGTDVKMRLLLKKDAKNFFSEDVDHEIELKKQQRSIAKEQGDIKLVEQLSQEIVGLNNMFNEYVHSVKVVWFPKFNKGFLYSLTSHDNVPGYPNMVTDLGAGQNHGHQIKHQYLFDSNVAISDANCKLESYDAYVGESELSRNVLDAYGRDFCRTSIDFFVKKIDPYGINIKKEHISSIDMSSSQESNIDNEKLEVLDGDAV